MHHAQGVVAVLDLVHEHAQRQEVVDLGEVLALERVLLHLGVDREDVLGAAGNLGFDAGTGELAAQAVDDLGDIALAGLAPVGHQLGDFFVALRLEVAEGEVFQLPFDLPDAQPVGERGEDLQGLLGDRATLLRR